MISIYEMCEARIRKGNPKVTKLYEIYADCKPVVRGKTTEPRITYLDALGKPTERQSIAKQYGACPKHISNLFKKHDGDFVAIHATLKNNMLKRNNKKK